MYISYCAQWRRQLLGTGARAPPPQLLTISFLVHFRVNLTAQLSKYCVVCEINWCTVNNSQLFQSVVTKLSHRAAAAPGPEVRRSSFAPPRNKCWRCHWLCILDIKRELLLLLLLLLLLCSSRQLSSSNWLADVDCSLSKLFCAVSMCYVRFYLCSRRFSYTLFSWIRPVFYLGVNSLYYLFSVVCCEFACQFHWNWLPWKMPLWNDPLCVRWNG